MQGFHVLLHGNKSRLEANAMLDEVLQAGYVDDKTRMLFVSLHLTNSKGYNSWGTIDTSIIFRLETAMTGVVSLTVESIKKHDKLKTGQQTDY